MKKASNCVFIGGIHGVGKSSLCAQYSSEYNVAHYVASELIRSLRNEDANLHKEVKDLSRNQDALLTAISHRISEQQYLLDGHFVIRVAGTGLSRVPIETFQAIRPLGIIIATGCAHDAADRIKLRDGREIAPAVLEEMQMAEVEHGTHVAKELGIRLHVLHEPSYALFHDAARSFLSPSH